MNLKIPKSSAEEDKKKFNPFLLIEKEISNKTNPQNYCQNAFQKLNNLINPFKNKSFQTNQLKFQQNAANNLDQKNPKLIQANKLDNKLSEENLFRKDFVEAKFKNSAESNEQKLNTASIDSKTNKENEFKSNLDIVNPLNDFSKPFTEVKNEGNKENSSFDSNLNSNACIIFSKNNNDYSNSEVNYFNINKKKPFNKNASDLNSFKFNNYTSNNTSNENNSIPNKIQNAGLSQLHLSQLNLEQEKDNLKKNLAVNKILKNPKILSEENEKGFDNYENKAEKNNQFNFKFINNDKSSVLLSDPFEKNSLKNKLENKNNNLHNKTEYETEQINTEIKNHFYQNDLLNKELRNISKKVINFKLKEESSNDHFKNNENSDINYSKVKNFINNTKQNEHFKLPFPNVETSKKANNNSNLYSDLLAINRNKNTKKFTNQLNESELKECQNFQSTLASKDCSTKDNSVTAFIESNNSNVQTNKANKAAINNLKASETLSFTNKLSNDFPTPKAENDITDKDLKSNNKANEVANKEQDEFNSNNINKTNKDEIMNFQPAKILKIKNAKQTNFPSDAKKQENAININLLKKKKVTINPASSVKKYAEQSEDYYLDLEIHKRNCYEASRFFTEVELNNLNPMEKNKLAGKLKLNTDKRQYWGRFNQLNGNKIESYRVYRDEDLNIPLDLQSKIHIKPENERFEEDMSSSDEIIQIAKVHYNSQFDLLKIKSFNFFMCNNLKYTQGLYWDD